MMLVRYQQQIAAFVDATRYELSPELSARRAGDVDRRRVELMCQWALQVRRLSGREPGRLPQDDPS